MKYTVYQQQKPIMRYENWHANIVVVGTVEAENEESAIKIAKSMIAFRLAEGLAQYPIVGE